MATTAHFKVVMLVDDNKIDAILNKKVLEKDSFSESVIVHNSSTKALEYLESIAANTDEYIPSLIFVDMMMPEMNGFQFVEKFEKLPQSIQDDAKIVFMSGSLLSQDQLEKLSHCKSVIKFVSKPLNKESLTIVLDLYKSL
ncbi:MAG: hypothetical protein RLZZ175_145 [Bacteroidota bacterium]|jgi:CheY-like chemotaxis protein